MEHGGATTNPRLQCAVAWAFVLGGLICNPWLLSWITGLDLVNYTYAKVFLLTLDVLAIGLGLLLLKLRPRTLVRQLLGITFSSALMIIVAELGLRGFYFASNKITPPKRFVSQKLGWETTPDLSLDYYAHGYGDIHYSTTKDGFRRFGDPATTKRKVLVLGDSVTQATQVSDGEAFFDVLARHPSVEVFAYGAGGYGSLQEYLILDQHHDIIQPDILVWQFSDNDFINNDYGLECISPGNNNHMVRPYYQDGKIVRLYPATRLRWLRQHSYLLRHLMIMGSEMMPSERGTLFDEMTFDDPRFQHALITTVDLLGLVRKRVGDIPVVAFAAYGGVPHEYLRQAFAQACGAQRIEFLDEVQDDIDRAKAAGIAVDALPDDPHWNAKGHEIVGTAVLEYLESNELLPPAPRPVGDPLIPSQD